MSYVIKKRGKYMEGHGYATGFGYNFHWTNNINEARHFADDDGAIASLARLSKGKIIEVDYLVPKESE
ncbi:hypothetical protein D3C78_885780 [compost metagenome]